MYRVRSVYERYSFILWGSLAPPIFPNPIHAICDATVIFDHAFSVNARFHGLQKASLKRRVTERMGTAAGLK